MNRLVAARMRRRRLVSPDRDIDFGPGYVDTITDRRLHRRNSARRFRVLWSAAFTDEHAEFTDDQVRDLMTRAGYQVSW